MHLPGDGTYFGLNPGVDGLVNVTFVTDLDRLRETNRSPEAVLDEAIAAVPSLRDRFSGACRAGRARVLAPLEVVVSRAFDDRVLLAGDAAGFLDRSPARACTAP